jgi:hypothetical protein
MRTLIFKSFLLLFFKKEVLSSLFFFEKKNQKTFANLHRAQSCKVSRRVGFSAPGTSAVGMVG